MALLFGVFFLRIFSPIISLSCLLVKGLMLKNFKKQSAANRIPSNIIALL